MSNCFAKQFFAGALACFVSTTVFAIPITVQEQLAARQIIFVSPAGVLINGNFINISAIINAAPNLPASTQPNLPYLQYSIFSQGNKIAADNGLAAFIGGAVRSDGLIAANLGYIGGTFALTFAANELVSFAVDRRFFHGMGKVFISAKSAATVLDQAIHMDAAKSVRSIYTSNGNIVLSGDPNGGKSELSSNIFIPTLYNFGSENSARPAPRKAILLITASKLNAAQVTMEPQALPKLAENSGKTAAEAMLSMKAGNVIFAARDSEPVFYNNVNAVAEYAGFTESEQKPEPITTEKSHVTVAVSEVPHDPSYINVNGSLSFVAETNTLGNSSVNDQTIPEHELLLAFTEVPARTAEAKPVVTVVAEAKPVVTVVAEAKPVVVAEAKPQHQSTPVTTYELRTNMVAAAGALTDTEIPNFTSNNAVINLDDSSGNVTVAMAENVDPTQAQELTESGSIIISDVIGDETPPPTVVAENEKVSIPPAPTITLASYVVTPDSYETADPQVHDSSFIVSSTDSNEMRGT